MLGAHSGIAMVAIDAAESAERLDCGRVSAACAAALSASIAAVSALSASTAAVSALPGYWQVPAVHVVPVGHLSTAAAPPVNRGDVQAVPAATVPETLSQYMPAFPE